MWNLRAVQEQTNVDDRSQEAGEERQEETRRNVVDVLPVEDQQQPVKRLNAVTDGQGVEEGEEREGNNELEQPDLEDGLKEQMLEEEERNEAALALDEPLGSLEIGLEPLVEESAASSSLQVICIS